MANRMHIFRIFLHSKSQLGNVLNRKMMVMMMMIIIIIIFLTILSLIIIIIIIIISLIRSIHTWVTASLHKFPGLFWVFQPILTILWYVLSRFFLWFPISPVFSQAFRDFSKWTIYDWYHSHPNILHIF